MAFGLPTFHPTYSAAPGMTPRGAPASGVSPFMQHPVFQHPASAMPMQQPAHNALGNFQHPFGLNANGFPGFQHPAMAAGGPMQQNFFQGGNPLLNHMQQAYPHLYGAQGQGQGQGQGQQHPGMGQMGGSGNPLFGKLRQMTPGNVMTHQQSGQSLLQSAFPGAPAAAAPAPTPPPIQYGTATPATGITHWSTMIR